MPQLVGREIGPIGFGLMGFTWRPQPCSEQQAFAAMRAAVDAGCTYWNAGEFYGPPEYNSAVLLHRYFAKYPEDAAKIVLCVKGAVNFATRKPDGSPAIVRSSMDKTLKQLQGEGPGFTANSPFQGTGLSRIDLFECARRDPDTPLEVTFKTLADEYIATDKLGGIALSEVSAKSIHEAVATGYKISAVEVELSMWATEVLENGIAAACAEHDIPLVAYSPVGRGMLTGQIKSLDDIPKDDGRRHFPRFQPENFAINVQIVDQVEALAKKKGCTPAQLAINWVRSLARRPGMPKTIIPIPGATTAERVRENSVLVELTDAEMDEIDGLLTKIEIKGGRYPDGMPVNT